MMNGAYGGGMSWPSYTGYGMTSNITPLEPIMTLPGEPTLLFNGSKTGAIAIPGASAVLSEEIKNGIVLFEDIYGPANGEQQMIIAKPATKERVAILIIAAVVLYFLFK